VGGRGGERGGGRLRDFVIDGNTLAKWLFKKSIQKGLITNRLKYVRFSQACPKRVYKNLRFMSCMSAVTV
jgi:hypothetical protein